LVSKYDEIRSWDEELGVDNTETVVVGGIFSMWRAVRFGDISLMARQ
jgi:hypothetical protein